MRVLLAVPTYENVSTETFGALWRISHCLPSDVELSEPLFLKGHGVQRARNDIALHALENGYDKVFTVDSDVIPPDNALMYLAQDTTDIVVGAYANRYDSRMGYSTMYLKTSHGKQCDNNNILSMEKIESLPKGRVELNGAGMGCALIDTDIFRNMEYPYFFWPERMNSGGSKWECSEDMYFCQHATALGYSIKLDTRVICKHKVSQVI